MKIVRDNKLTLYTPLFFIDIPDTIKNHRIYYKYISLHECKTLTRWAPVLCQAT